MTSEEQNKRELDALLESRIEGARIAMLSAPDVENRRVHFQQMRALIAQRSPEQVERMETERGLRAL